MKLHFGVGYGFTSSLFLKDTPIPQIWLRVECLEYSLKYKIDYGMLFTWEKDLIKSKLSNYKKLI